MRDINENVGILVNWMKEPTDQPLLHGRFYDVSVFVQDGEQEATYTATLFFLDDDTHADVDLSDEKLRTIEVTSDTFAGALEEAANVALKTNQRGARPTDA